MVSKYLLGKVSDLFKILLFKEENNNKPLKVFNFNEQNETFINKLLLG